MLAVRGTRALALLVALVLAVAGVLALSATKASAAVTHQVTINVSGPANLAGISVSLSQELIGNAGQVFNPPAYILTTDGSGQAVFSAVDEGVYFLMIDAGPGWVQGWGFEVVFSDWADSVALVPGLTLRGTVRDAATGFDLPGMAVWACGSNTSNPGPFQVGCYVDLRWAYIDLVNGVLEPRLEPGSGDYEITVPYDDQWEISAFDPLAVYADQTWDHRSGCGCVADLVDLPPNGALTPTGPYDFDLFREDGTIPFDLFVKDTTLTAQSGVDARLLSFTGARAVLGDHATTDGSGFTQVFATTDGHYGLQFAIGGLTWPIVSYDLGSGAVALNSCTIDMPGVTIADSFVIDVVLDTAGHPCGYVAPSAPTAVPKKRTYIASVFATVVSPTASPTPTATPTSSPSPSSSSSESPSASPEPTVDPQPTQNPLDLWWLWLLLLLIVALIVFFIVRAILRR